MVVYQNIPDIKEAFFDIKKPVWRLYNHKAKAAFPTGKSQHSNLLASNTEEMPLGASWERLEKQLQRFTLQGGYCNIWIGDSPTDAYNIPIWFPQNNTPGSGGNNTGMNGLSVHGIGQFYEQRMNDQIQLYEMRRELEDMRNQQAPNSVWERIGERLLQSDQLGNIASTLVSTLLRGTPQSAPVRRPPSAPAIQRRDDEEKPVDSTQIGGAFVESIADGFDSEEEMKSYLSRVARLFQADPETMKRVIDTIAEQNEVQ